MAIQTKEIEKQLEWRYAAKAFDPPELGGSERLRAQGYRVHTICSFTEEE